MDVRILGTLEVARDGEGLTPSAPRQRALLALLALHVGEPVSVDRIIDELWGEDPPPAAKNSLQSMISNLRTALEPNREPGAESTVIVRTPAGYVLDGDPGCVDANRFEAMLNEARSVLPSDPEAAASLAQDALGLWRGPALADFTYEEFAQEGVRRLEDRRLAAVETRLEAQLALGHHAEVITELERLVEEHPLREAMRAALMLALYRAGRQADALRVHETGRLALADLGLEPGGELRSLEQRILDQDPGLLLAGAADVRTERPNPYKGLLAFREEDAADFFGRDELIAEIIERIDVAGPGGLTALVGPSGSGKSSVVSAGVLPTLREGTATGSDSWLVCRMVPGSRPFEELEAALLREAPEAPAALLDVLRSDDSGLRRASRLVAGGDEGQILLIIDQFEELFTMTPSGVRTDFLAALIGGLEADRASLRVLLVLRSDFLGEPLSHPRLADLLREGTMLVPPMGAAELEEAIVGPAARVGVEVGRSLVVGAVADVEGRPGALPMLQYALTETFDRRRTDVVTLLDYEDVGGLNGALTNTAEMVLRGLSEEQAAVARQVFLRLVAPGEGAADTRRRIGVAELQQTALESSDVDTVLDAFGRARLLTFDNDPASGHATVEIAHEALLSEWPLLEGWVDAARDDIRTERRIQALATEWVEAGRAESYLIRGQRLGALDEWRRETGLQLTALEEEFLDASLAAERAEERARATTRRRVLTAMAVVSVTAVVFAVIALVRGAQASRDARLAEARGLAGQAVAAIDTDPELAILLGLEAMHLEALPEAQEALHRALAADRLLVTLPAPGVAATYLGHDRVAILELDSTITIYDVADPTVPRVVRTVGQPGWLDLGLADSPGGTSLTAVPESDALAVGAPDGRLIVIDLEPDAVRWSRQVAQGPLIVEVDQAGTTIVTKGTLDGSNEVLVFIDLESGSEARLECYCDRGMAMTTGPNPVVISDRDLRAPLAVYDLEGNLLPGSSVVPVMQRRFVAGGHYVVGVLESELRPASIHIPTNSIAATFSGHRAEVEALAVNGAATVAASGSVDGKIFAWDMRSGAGVAVLAGHSEAIVSLEFRDDDRQLLSVGLDGTARLWDLSPAGTSEAEGVEWDESVLEIASVPGSNVLVVRGGTGGEPSLEALNTSGGGGRGTLVVDSDTNDRVSIVGGDSKSLGVHPSGEVAAVVRGERVLVFDLETHSQLFALGAPIPDEGEEPTVVSYSPEGEMLAVGTGGGRVRLYDVPHPKEAYPERWVLGDPGPEVTDLGFATGGSLLVLDEAGEVRSWDTGSGIAAHVAADTRTKVIAVSARLVVEGRSDGTWRAIEPTTGRVQSEAFAHPGGVEAVAISPGGTYLATGGVDAAVRVWDLRTGELLFGLSRDQAIWAVAFSASGERLYAGGNDRIVTSYVIPSDELVAIAESRVTRSLTDAECARYLGTDGCGG